MQFMLEVQPKYDQRDGEEALPMDSAGKCDVITTVQVGSLKSVPKK